MYERGTIKRETIVLAVRYSDFRIGVEVPLPGSRLLIFYGYRCKFSILRLATLRLNFTYSRSHTFRYRRQNTNSGFHKNRTHNFRTSRCTRLPTRPLARRCLLPTCPLHTNGGCGKSEAHINWSMVVCKKAAPLLELP